MHPATFKEYLKNRYDNQLDYYEDKSGKNQKRYKTFQWILIILSTATTILAALPDKLDLQYVVVATAGLVAILTSGLKTFQYQELWVSYRSTIEQLKPEIYYYNFNVGDYGQAGVDKETLFVSRVEKILNKEHDGWPVFTKLQDQSNQQVNDDLQRKLDELLRERFKTQKTGQLDVTTDAVEPKETTDTEQPEETTDTDKPDVKTDAAAEEDTNDETDNNNKGKGK
jgi:Protein of unknown function (DUF4231)